jgi:hypothetical protein
MAGKQTWRLAVLVVVLGLVGADTALAGPYFGDGSWWWRPACECPRGAYSPLHYWAPSAYQLRAQVHPSNLDQFPPGPSPAVPPSYDFNSYRCRSIPATPTSPYANPEAYFGQPIVPRRE